MRKVQWFRDGSKPDYYPNTNWADLVLDKHVLTTQHSLNFSGGSDKVRFFSSAGYLYNDDFMPGVSNDRYNLDLNVQADITKWLTLKSGVKYIRNQSDTKHGTAWIANFVMVPSIMVAQTVERRMGKHCWRKQATQTFMKQQTRYVPKATHWSKKSTN
mgnify:CR=1 FL=1